MDGRIQRWMDGENRMDRWMIDSLNRLKSIDLLVGLMDSNCFILHIVHIVE